MSICLSSSQGIFDDTDADNELEQRLKRGLLDKVTKYIDDEKEQMRILRVSSIYWSKIAVHNSLLIFCYVYDSFDPVGFFVLADCERTMVERELKKLSARQFLPTLATSMFAEPGFSVSSLIGRK